jgi:hypothetical protein
MSSTPWSCTIVARRRSSTSPMTPLQKKKKRTQILYGFKPSKNRKKIHLETITDGLFWTVLENKVTKWISGWFGKIVQNYFWTVWANRPYIDIFFPVSMYIYF